MVGVWKNSASLIRSHHCQGAASGWREWRGDAPHLEIRQTEPCTAHKLQVSSTPLRSRSLRRCPAAKDPLKLRA